VTSSYLAQSAYNPVRSAVKTERGTEHAAFERVTAQLSRANRADASVALKASALHDNRRLWTLMASNVADSANALPQTLRAQIFYLAEFTLQHSRKALSGDASLTPLIDINTAVMRGLRGEAQAA
jgi:flagellar biosynthesis activator protein FlaF